MDGPPTEGGRDRRADPRPAAYARTDLGNADRFADQHADLIRHCAGWQQWLVWDGARWAPGAPAVMERAKDTARRMAEEADARPGPDWAADTRHARASASLRGLRAMVELAKSDPQLAVRPGDLDRDPWLLNVRNGTLHLRTGTLRPHDPADLLTQVAPVEFDPGARCPRWLTFLERVFGGDAELIGYVRRLVGYCLTGLVTEQVLAVLHGDGANGKSTLINTVLGVLGPDYGMKAGRDLLTADKHDRHPTGLARLFGKRLAVATETADGARLDEPLVKELTGGDPVQVRRMREDPWEFRPTCKLLLVTNHRPRIRGTDDGIWRRQRLVPFAVRVPDGDRDPDLPEKLAAESAGILAWAVGGCREWDLGGLGEAAAVRRATDGYRAESDRIGAFLAECCEPSPGGRIRVSELYAAYKRWCLRHAEEVENGTVFGRYLNTRGYEVAKKVGGHQARAGIRLRE